MLVRVLTILVMSPLKVMVIDETPLTLKYKARTAKYCSTSDVDVELPLTLPLPLELLELEDAELEDHFSLLILLKRSNFEMWNSP